MVVNFKPGIYPDLDINLYHKSPGISSSGMKVFLESPAQYNYDYIIEPNLPKDVETIEKTSKALAIGRAVHLFALEPHLFNEQFYLFEDDGNLPRKGSAKAAELLQTAAGRTVIKPGDLDDAQAMADSLSRHPLLQDLKKASIEHSIFWESGVLNAPLRARPDFYTDDFIADIKTTASFEDFERYFKKNGYARQAAMQIDALNKLTGKTREFFFIVVQKKPPYFVAQYQIDPFDLMDARLEYTQIASEYAECLLYNEWPDNCENTRILKTYRPKRNPL